METITFRNNWGWTCQPDAVLGTVEEIPEKATGAYYVGENKKVLVVEKAASDWALAEIRRENPDAVMLGGLRFGIWMDTKVAE